MDPRNKHPRARLTNPLLRLVPFFYPAPVVIKTVTPTAIQEEQKKDPPEARHLALFFCMHVVRE